MKDVSFEVLQTPVSSPVPFSKAGDPFAVSADKILTAMPQPFLSADRFQNSPSAEDFVYSSVFVTILCAFIGWLVLHPREIFTALTIAAYSIGDGVLSAFHTLM